MSRDSKDAAKVKKVLDDCLKQPDNKVCSECGMRQPRWASTNLGCFMCIRCSGIHRNLGVHISKVKSVSLDTWPMEQAEFMATMGNEKCNAVWEYALPANRKPNENDTTYLVEQFIKDKYDKRMFLKPEKPIKKKGKKAKEAEAAAEKAAAEKAKTAKKAPSAAAKKKKAVSESDSDSDDSDDSDSDDSEDSEDERQAAKKKKAAAAAAAKKKKAAKPKSESEDEESEDEEPKKKAKAKKADKAKKGAKVSGGM